VICSKAGSDAVDGEEGNDTIRGGQGDDGGGTPPTCYWTEAAVARLCSMGVTRGPSTYVGLNGGDGSDVVKGQQDDDSMEGQNDKLYGGNGDDCIEAACTASGIRYTPSPGTTS
jgi:Ca2+-binding RTX toxin-like protein